VEQQPARGAPRPVSAAGRGDEDKDGDAGAGGARLFVVLCCSLSTFWRWIRSIL